MVLNFYPPEDGKKDAETCRGFIILKLKEFYNEL
jgi:hypothetical protein